MSQRTTTEIRRIIAAMPPSLRSAATAQALCGAAHYLSTHGWTQGAYYDDEPIDDTNTRPPCACTLGAIWTVVHPKDTHDPDLDELNELTPVQALGWYLHGTRPEFCDDVISAWNDVEGQTADHVILTLSTLGFLILAQAGDAPHGDGDR